GARGVVRGCTEEACRWRRPRIVAAARESARPLPGRSVPDRGRRAPLPLRGGLLGGRRARGHLCTGGDGGRRMVASAPRPAAGSPPLLPVRIPAGGEDVHAAGDGRGRPGRGLSGGRAAAFMGT